MLQGGIERECVQVQGAIDKLQDSLKKKRELMQYCKTPSDILAEYVEIEERMAISSRKIRNRLSKEKYALEGQYKHLLKEVQKQREIYKFEDEIEKETKQLNITKNFVDTSLQTIINILIDYRFVENSSEEYPYQLTDKGKIAVNVQEVNGMVFGDLLNDNRLDLFTAPELCAIFSCFANMSIPKEKRMQLNSLTTTPRIRQILNTVQDYYQEMENLELTYRIDSTEEYEIKYELVNLTLEWCGAATEGDCKQILQKSKQIGISIGEFTKAILKINNIASEFEKVCTIQGNMKLLEAIKHIPQLTLKSIATNQSLYL